MRENNPGAGPLIGSIIIVILLLIGGYFSWQNSKTSFSGLDQPQGNVSDSPAPQPVPAIVAPAKPAQASTELKDIEADATTVDTASLDSGLDNLDLLTK